MNKFKLVFDNFFRHKDFLPHPNELPGTLFSPLQIIFCLLVAATIILLAIKCSKKSVEFQKKIFIILWFIMIITEPIIVLYETLEGESFLFDAASAFALWPCSIFLYTLPFAVYGKENVKLAACGYICTFGLLGGLINFIYPATYISHYSCISFAGFRTIFYHGSMIFTAITMILSKYHTYTSITKWKQVLLPFIPTLIVSIPANILNFCIKDADYMFFKLQSFFFAPIGKALPHLVSMIIVYIIYLIIHTTPYLPSVIKHARQKHQLCI